MLTIVAGPSPGRSFGLSRDFITVGRDPSCDVVLAQNLVSRKHARIVRVEDGFELEDLGSSDGTRINGQPIDGPTRLRDGDRVGIADCLLRFSDPASASPPSDSSSSSTILGERDATRTAEWVRVGVRPAEKLAALLEVARGMVGALDLGDVLDKALDTLFRLFPRAERGLVLLRDEAAGGRLAPAAVKVRRGEPAGPHLSRAIIENVIKGGKAVLIGDVTVDDRFGASNSVDEARIRTLMCVPLRDHADRPAGILQLDTSDPNAGFTSDDLDVLAAVAGQVGLAVVNARLLGRARREQRRLELLAEAGVALASSLQVEETLGAVARLAVPYLADLCVVDLLSEDGSVRRVVAEHADEAKQPLADELRRRFTPDPESMNPAMVAMRTGEPQEARSVTDESLAATSLNGEHLDLLRRLGYRSYLCLPLIANGRTLGVLSLVATEARRPLGPGDRATAEELARRAALSAENARLYREVQKAGLAKDRFLAVLSHEMRTPLTPVLLAVSSLLDSNETADRATLEMVRRNVELETRLIDDLLDVAQIARGQLRLDFEMMDAHQGIHRAVEICEPEATAGGLRIDLDLKAEAHHVRADPARLLQVFWNLIRNAAKFTAAGGVLTIRTYNEPPGEANGDGTHLVVEFHDTGVGIEPHLAERIFEPFEQGAPELRGRQGGLGLGLAIGRAIAEAHGGHLSARSEGRGSGSTFRLVLPSMHEAAASCEAIATPPPVAAEGDGLKILLVEDNRDTLRYLALVLRSRGHEVLETSSVEDAKDKAASGIDLLVSDIELPDGTGLELIHALGGSRVPAIAMSGYGSEDDVRMSLGAGFAEHLTKPVDSRTLDAAIRRVRAKMPNGQVPPEIAHPAAS